MADDLCPGAPHQPQPTPLAQAAALFRQEALDHRSLSHTAEGHPLEISPRWLQRVYTLLVGFFVAGLGFAALASIDEYAQGKAVVAVDGPDAAPQVLVSLPGRHRPRLRRGMMLRLALQNRPHTYQDLVIDSVSDRVLGVAASRQLLGPEVAEAIVLEGPQVLVKAHWPHPQVAGDDRGFIGMRGRAEVRLGSQPLLSVLVPALRRAGGSHG